jgi:hypothetical protein
MLPQDILEQFTRIPPDTPFDNKYFGVYNKILNRCFFEQNFTVEPQYLLPPAVDVPPIDFVLTTHFEFQRKDVPLFFLEIRPPLHIHYISSRVDVDALMRARLCALYELAPISGVYGICVMGQRFAIYYMNNNSGRITPDYVAPSMECITDTVPASRWETDITTEVGYRKFMEVIGDVKDMAAAL